MSVPSFIAINPIVSLKTINVNLMMALKERITKSFKIHLLGTMNVCTKSGDKKNLKDVEIFTE